VNRQQRRAEAREASTKPKAPILAGATVQSLFDSALIHHEAGRLNDAERLYVQILITSPRHADAMHLLGLIAYQTGQPRLAVEKICDAIRINGAIAFYHSNLSNALRQLGRFDEAAAACRTATELEPNFSQAHANLGAALYEGGRLDEAIAAYNTAIRLDPNLPENHLNMGNAVNRLGRFEEALRAYAKAVHLKPNYAEAHSNMGALFESLGRFAEALAACNAAIGIKADYAEAHSNLGNALKGLGRFDEALASYEKAISLKPYIAESHANLAALLERLGRFEEALAACNRAISLKPDYAEAYSNRGNMLTGLGRFDEALTAYHKSISLKPRYVGAHANLGALMDVLGNFVAALAACRAAIELNPDYAEAHANLGHVLEKLGRYDEALIAFDKAISLNPDDAQSHFNLGFTLLKTGSFQEGWDKFEWRWKTKQMARYQRHFEKPIWLGEAVSGKTLLLHAEQGLGDTLQFCRYAPLAAARGLRVILEVQRPLIRLLRSLPGVDLVIGHGGELPAFDFHAPLMSLPLAFQTLVTTVPAETPYLHADENAVAVWRQRLDTISVGSPRIGLIWAGNPLTHSPELAEIDRRRSIAPSLFAPLFEIPDLKFYSLQKDGPAAPVTFPLIDYMREMADFADTAALIANLDLVISVDTAVAHLAGALGKPVWLLNRFDSCWRWLAGRRDSPWYPGLRLYNQTQPGDWQPVIREITTDLILFQENWYSRRLRE